MSVPKAEHSALQDVEERRPQTPQLPHELAAEMRKSNESQLALIFNGVSDLLFLIRVEAGPQFRCLAVNPSYVENTGWTHEQVEGKLVEEFLPPEKARFVREKYTAAMQARSPTTYEESTNVPAGQIIVET